MHTQYPSGLLFSHLCSRFSSRCRIPFFLLVSRSFALPFTFLDLSWTSGHRASLDSRTPQYSAALPCLRSFSVILSSHTSTPIRLPYPFGARPHISLAPHPPEVPLAFMPHCVILHLCGLLDCCLQKIIPGFASVLSVSQFLSRLGVCSSFYSTNHLLISFLAVVGLFLPWFQDRHSASNRTLLDLVFCLHSARRHMALSP